jgi:hypothetical protein
MDGAVRYYLLNLSSRAAAHAHGRQQAAGSSSRKHAPQAPPRYRYGAIREIGYRYAKRCHPSSSSAAYRAIGRKNVVGFRRERLLVEVDARAGVTATTARHARACPYFRQ